MTQRAEGDDRAGRPPVTTAQEIERVALGLFARRGFAATTVDDIAAAAGIARRTFFRYYASKKDVVWGEFDQGVREMASALASHGRDVDLRDAVRDAVVQCNDLPSEALSAHRQRMALILNVPELQAHGTLRYAAWRAVVADYAGSRLGCREQDFVPQLVGRVALAAALTAYDAWLRDLDADLGQLLHAAFTAIELPAG